MNKIEFTRILEAAIKEECEYVTVFVQMPDLPLPEMITNPIENIPMKLEYYESAYDEQMRLKAKPEIMIVGVTTKQRLTNIIAKGLRDNRRIL